MIVEFWRSEAAQLKVSQDLLTASDSGLLSLLELSAAPDPDDHRILVRKLEDVTGIKDQTSSWFTLQLSQLSTHPIMRVLGRQYLQYSYFQRGVVHVFRASQEVHTIQRILVRLQGKFLLSKLKPQSERIRWRWWTEFGRVSRILTQNGSFIFLVIHACFLKRLVYNWVLL